MKIDKRYSKEIKLSKEEVLKKIDTQEKVVKLYANMYNAGKKFLLSDGTFMYYFVNAVSLGTLKSELKENGFKTTYIDGSFKGSEEVIIEEVDENTSNLIFIMNIKGTGFFVINENKIMNMLSKHLILDIDDNILEEVKVTQEKIDNQKKKLKNDVVIKNVFLATLFIILIFSSLSLYYAVVMSTVLIVLCLYIYGKRFRRGNLFLNELKNKY